ncbi:MAG: hypothetical protein BMS9Abin23_0369 [Thermodesulfobacteriota bacterium]|nr:MAG: hypothetical protein BMS9Abin23_0369 [Thermodesulfobacteriota bacterium]
MKRFFVYTVLFVTSMALTGTALAADGAAIYKTKCATCHGAKGQGAALGPALKGNEFIKSGSDGDITGVILKGRTGDERRYEKFSFGMPAQRLGDDDAREVVKYLRSLASE